MICTRWRTEISCRDPRFSYIARAKICTVLGVVAPVDYFSTNAFVDDDVLRFLRALMSHDVHVVFTNWHRWGATEGLGK
jgi:hypothetical protein